MPSVAAPRYARALTDIAFEPGSTVDADRIAAELGAFVDTVNASADLRTVFATPAVSHSKKRALAASICRRLGASSVLQNFLSVVIGHGRTGELNAIREAFLGMVDERRGVVRADIASATELSERERQSLEQQLAAMTGKRVRAVYSTDSKLLGGALVRIGSQLYDGSVRGRLNAMGAHLTESA